MFNISFWDMSTNSILASLDSLDGATAASDFMKQYTTRQGYRHTDPAPEHEDEWLRYTQIGCPGQITGDDEETIAALENMQHRSAANKFVAIAEQQDVLRRAAALLCRSTKVMGLCQQNLRILN